MSNEKMKLYIGSAAGVNSIESSKLSASLDGQQGLVSCAI